MLLEAHGVTCEFVPEAIDGVFENGALADLQKNVGSSGAWRYAARLVGPPWLERRVQLLVDDRQVGPLMSEAEVPGMFLDDLGQRACREAELLGLWGAVLQRGGATILIAPSVRLANEPGVVPRALTDPIVTGLVSVGWAMVSVRSAGIDMVEGAPVARPFWPPLVGHSHADVVAEPSPTNRPHLSRLADVGELGGPQRVTAIVVLAFGNNSTEPTEARPADAVRALVSNLHDPGSTGGVYRFAELAALCGALPIFEVGARLGHPDRAVEAIDLLADLVKGDSGVT